MGGRGRSPKGKGGGQIVYVKAFSYKVSQSDKAAAASAGPKLVPNWLKLFTPPDHFATADWSEKQTCVACVFGLFAIIIGLGTLLVVYISVLPPCVSMS